MAALAEGGQDHGALVQQILETQKELEDVNKRQQHKTAIEIEINFFVLLVMLKREFNEFFWTLLIVNLMPQIRWLVIFGKFALEWIVS